MEGISHMPSTYGLSTDLQFSSHEIHLAKAKIKTQIFAILK